MSDSEELHVWRKSSKSASGDCIEVAAATGLVLVRDSQNPDASILRFPSAAWSAFLKRARTTGPDNQSA